MIFCLTKAAPLFAGLSRPISGWLSIMCNFSKAVPTGQNPQGTPADNGMFGLLVSNDAARAETPMSLLRWVGRAFAPGVLMMQTITCRRRLSFIHSSLDWAIHIYAVIIADLNPLVPR